MFIWSAYNLFIRICWWCFWIQPSWVQGYINSVLHANLLTLNEFTWFIEINCKRRESLSHFIFKRLSFFLVIVVQFLRMNRFFHWTILIMYTSVRSHRSRSNKIKRKPKYAFKDNTAYVFAFLSLFENIILVHLTSKNVSTIFQKPSRQKWKYSR